METWRSDYFDVAEWCDDDYNIMAELIYRRMKKDVKNSRPAYIIEDFDRGSWADPKHDPIKKYAKYFEDILSMSVSMLKEEIRDIKDYIENRKKYRKPQKTVTAIVGKKKIAVQLTIYDFGA